MSSPPPPQSQQRRPNSNSNNNSSNKSTNPPDNGDSLDGPYWQCNTRAPRVASRRALQNIRTVKEFCEYHSSDDEEDSAAISRSCSGSDREASDGGLSSSDISERHDRRRSNQASNERANTATSNAINLVSDSDSDELHAGHTRTSSTSTMSAAELEERRRRRAQKEAKLQAELSNEMDGRYWAMNSDSPRYNRRSRRKHVRSSPMATRETRSVSDAPGSRDLSRRRFRKQPTIASMSRTLCTRSISSRPGHRRPAAPSRTLFECTIESSAGVRRKVAGLPCYNDSNSSCSRRQNDSR